MTVQRTATRHRVGAVTLACLLSGVLATGCSGGGDQDGDTGAAKEGGGSSPSAGAPDGDGASVLQALNRTTKEAESAEMTVEVDIEAGGQQQSATGEGALDLADGDSHLTMDAGGQEIEQRVVDRTLYQKMPEGQSSALPEGKTWTSVDLTEVAADLSGSGSGLMTDPSANFGYTEGLEGAESEKLGTEKIGGVETTHYRVEIDVARLAQGEEAAEEQLREQLGETLPMELWVDGDGLLRRQQVELTVPAGSGSGDGGQSEDVKIRTVTELSDFGTEVNVSAPSEDKVADLTEELSRQKGQQAAG